MYSGALFLISSVLKQPFCDMKICRVFCLRWAYSDAVRVFI